MVFDECASPAGILTELLIAGLGKRGKILGHQVHERRSGQATRGCSLAGLLFPELEDLLAVLVDDRRYGCHGLLRLQECRTRPTRGGRFRLPTSKGGWTVFRHGLAQA